jgi:MerR family transcriptional regulator, copper efflux regulator
MRTVLGMALLQVRDGFLDCRVWTMVHSQPEQVQAVEPMLIGDFARAVGSTKDTVRFYTRLGLLVAGERVAGQRVYAVYAEEQLERFSFIEQCKSLGFTLQEIGDALRERDAGSLTALRQQALLEEKLRSLEERIAALRQAETRLRAKLEKHGC